MKERMKGCLTKHFKFKLSMYFTIPPFSLLSISHSHYTTFRYAVMYFIPQKKRHKTFIQNIHASLADLTLQIQIELSYYGGNPGNIVFQIRKRTPENINREWGKEKLPEMYMNVIFCCQRNYKLNNSKKENSSSNITLDGKLSLTLV